MFLISFQGIKTWSADFDRNLLAAGLSDVLRAVLLWHVLRRARRLEDLLASRRTCSVANLPDGSVALLDRLLVGLRGEGDLAELFEVVFAKLLLLSQRFNFGRN